MEQMLGPAEGNMVDGAQPQPPKMKSSGHIISI